MIKTYRISRSILPRKSLTFLVVATLISSLSSTISQANTPTFAVSNMKVDKSSLVGPGTIKIDFDLATTNLTEWSTSPLIVTTTIDDDFEACPNTSSAQLISGNIQSGSYTATLNYCNQMGTGAHQIYIVRKAKIGSFSHPGPTINYVNNAPPPTPTPTPTQQNSVRIELSKVLVEYEKLESVRPDLGLKIQGQIFSINKVLVSGEPSIAFLTQTQKQLTALQKSKKTISCKKGKTTKKVSGTNPKCPKGYKVKA